MADKRTPGSRPGLIHCDNCGEEYSASYKRCPFCDEYEDEYEDDLSSSDGSSGKRLASSKKRGGGYSRTSPLQVVGVIFSLAIIAVAVWIIVTKLLPAIHRGNTGTVDPNDGITTSAPPAASDPVSPSSDPAVVPSEGTEPSPDVSEEPIDGTGAVGFTLEKTDVTFKKAGEKWTPVVTFTPEGSTAGLTWTSEDPSIATVSADGEVTAVGPGTTTITATMANGTSHSCIIRCDFTAPSTPSATTSTTYKMSNPDFTFYKAGEQTTLRVVGYDGAVTWSSSNPSVVSVDSNGVCKAVGTGRNSCTITATLADGTTVTAIARIRI